ncbi:FAS1-like dehydratase domain-containing protein [Microbacterium lacus]|uniref:FAS1-like dehydratase domain-containing protein n=1 Tax=Microbacterium lacus TaxID=415217 RepID=A0ABN2HEM5_9MICO
MTDVYGPVATTAPAEEIVQVTRDAIRRFAFAAGISALEHHDAEVARCAGHRDVIGPPYFFASLGLGMGHVRPRDELSLGGIALDDPLAFSKVVAGETCVRWHGTIYAGDTIRIRCTFVGVERKAGRSGVFDVYTFRREYFRGDELLIDETYSRIAR